MNLGHAYAKSSSYVESMPRIILPIFSLYLHNHCVHRMPGNAHASMNASNGSRRELMHNAVPHRHPRSQSERTGLAGSFGFLHGSHTDRCVLVLRDSLVLQGVHDCLIQLTLRCGAERQCDGCQRIHLLVLLQNLLVLRAPAVVLLHPASSTHMMRVIPSVNLAASVCICSDLLLVRAPAVSMLQPRAADMPVDKLGDKKWPSRHICLEP